MTHNATATTKDEAMKHIEKVEKGLASSSSSTHGFDNKLAASIRHRVDWRLIPALGAMYGISLMVSVVPGDSQYPAS